MRKCIAWMGLLVSLPLGCATVADSANGASLNESAGGTGYGNGGSGSGGGNNGGKTKATQATLEKINAPECAGAKAEQQMSLALLEFVIDVSSTMSDVPNGAPASKWEITKTALQSAILDQLPDNTGVGVLTFPNMNTTANNNDKLVPVKMLDTSTCVNTAAMVKPGPLGASGSAQRAAIAAALQTAKVAGGTPTDDALEFAYKKGVTPGLESYPYYKPFVIVVTDAQPTFLLGCAGTGASANPVDWHPIVEFIQNLGDPEITQPQVGTFVIGVPGSETPSYSSKDGRQWLSMAARLGGTSRTEDCTDTGPNYCHFDLTPSTQLKQDLTDVLKTVFDAVMPCKIRIPPPSAGGVPDPTAINVIYKQNVVNGTPTDQWIIGKTTDESCGGGTLDGWYIEPSDPTGTTLALCPTTCKAIQMDNYAVLYVRQGCKTVTVG